MRAGRVVEAQRDIDDALKLVRENADADALSSVISVVKNDKLGALDLAQHATQLEPLNPRTWIALSYAQQASFRLEEGARERGTFRRARPAQLDRTNAGRGIIVVTG